MQAINQENTFTKVNTKIQMKNDQVIKNFLLHYKNYELKDELLHVKEENEEIILDKSELPDLVKINSIFNKNNCFYGNENIRGNNYFPRVMFNLNKINETNDINNENKSFPFQSKISGESLDSKKSKDSYDKSGSNVSGTSCEEEEEEEEEDDNDDEKNKIFEIFQNYSIDKINPVEISNQKLIMKNLFNIKEEAFFQFIQGAGSHEIQNNNLKFLFELYLFYQGWKVEIKKRNSQFKLNTFDLFDRLTKVIEKNLKLDDLIISNNHNNDTYEGGKFFFMLKKFLEEYYKNPYKKFGSFELNQPIYFNKFQINNNNNFNNNVINNQSNGFLNNINTNLNNQNINYFTFGQSNHDNNNFSSFGYA